MQAWEWAHGEGMMRQAVELLLKPAAEEKARRRGSEKCNPFGYTFRVTNFFRGCGSGCGGLRWLVYANQRRNGAGSGVDSA